MLSISPPMKGVGHSEYYIKLACQDYYNTQGAEPGRWFGTGAERLGLRGSVQSEAYENLLWGRSPDGTQPLVQNADDPDRQTAWDLTFSAPKSVSVLWASAPEAVREVIERAHRRAVETALRFLEETAGVTRRGQAGARREHADVVFATFFHICSRAFDQQIHSHCLLINLAVRQDGTTGALWSRDFFRAKMTAGAIYQVQFAADLGQDLGLAIAPDRIGFQIEGVPKLLCRVCSKRRQTIKAAMEEQGATDAVSAKRITLETRPRKESVSRAELFARWRATTEAHGWTEAHAARLVRNSRTQPCSQQTLEKAFRAACAQLPKQARTPGRLRGLAAELAVKLAADAKTVRPILMRLLCAQWGQSFSHPVQAHRAQDRNVTNAQRTGDQSQTDGERKQLDLAAGGGSSVQTTHETNASTPERKREQPNQAQAPEPGGQDRSQGAPPNPTPALGLAPGQEQQAQSASTSNSHEHAEQQRARRQSKSADETKRDGHKRKDQKHAGHGHRQSHRRRTRTRAHAEEAQRAQNQWHADLLRALDPRNAETQAQRLKLFFKWRDLMLENALPRPLPPERFLVPRRQRRRNQQFIDAFEKKISRIPTEEQTRQRLTWHAVNLACKHKADTRTLAQALQDLDVGAEHGWMHVKWQRLFPQAPGWSPVKNWKAPIVILGGATHRQWGKIVWKKSLVLAELRVQKRRLFPKAPKWSFAHGLEIPALRLAKKTPKSEQVVRPLTASKQQEHGHQQSH
jgi:conjugative relaxase-like TrwC/TraI family protein